MYTYINYDSLIIVIFYDYKPKQTNKTLHNGAASDSILQNNILASRVNHFLQSGSCTMLIERFFQSLTPIRSAICGVAFTPVDVSTTTVTWSAVIVPASSSWWYAAPACRRAVTPRECRRLPKREEVGCGLSTAQIVDSVHGRKSARCTAPWPRARATRP
jgi:hypothetical protein